VPPKTDPEDVDCVPPPKTDPEDIGFAPPNTDPVEEAGCEEPVKADADAEEGGFEDPPKTDPDKEVGCDCEEPPKTEPEDEVGWEDPNTVPVVWEVASPNTDPLVLSDPNVDAAVVTEPDPKGGAGVVAVEDTKDGLEPEDELVDIAPEPNEELMEIVPVCPRAATSNGDAEELTALLEVTSTGEVTVGDPNTDPTVDETFDPPKIEVLVAVEVPKSDPPVDGVEKAAVALVENNPALEVTVLADPKLETVGLQFEFSLVIALPPNAEVADDAAGFDPKTELLLAVVELGTTEEDALSVLDVVEEAVDEDPPNIEPPPKFELVAELALNVEEDVVNKLEELAELPKEKAELKAVLPKPPTELVAVELRLPKRDLDAEPEASETASVLAVLGNSGIWTEEVFATAVAESDLDNPPKENSDPLMGS